jgi:Ca2+-binding RTX toxin-like protein
VLIGNGGNDTLAAGAGDDTLVGGNGNDMLSGMGGVDVLEGGAGVDTASFADETGAIIATAAGASLTTVTIGGIAADTLLEIENLVGGAGNDTLTGTIDANQIRGGMGNDTLFGLDGSDVLASGGGSDRLDGDAGIDTADFSDYTDPATAIIATVVSTATATVNIAATGDQVTLIKIENIIGSAGDDTLSGDNIGNVLQGGAGNDTLTGNGGNDLLRGGEGVNVLIGGNGTDTADFSDRKAIVIAFTADTSATAATVGGVGVGTLLGIESLLGGTLSDTLTGDARVNRLVGNAGNDLLDGGEGNDVLEGGAGTDTVNYSSRSVSVVASSAGTVVTTAVIGGTEQDKLTNIEHITGGSAADTLTGNETANRLTGNAGNDILAGGAGGDVLAGGANDDTLSGGTGSDRLDGGLGNDLFVFDTAVNGVDIDTVVSFAGAGIAGGDALHLDDAVFTALSPGALSALAFESGTTGLATAATTRIVYDTASGALYYDADGNAAGAAALQFATLLSKPAGLSAGDFLVT